MAITTLDRVERADIGGPLGSELRGASLADLDDAGIDELRQLVAERGVVVVRDQSLTIEEHIELGRRLGPLHIHPAYADAVHPEGLRVHADETSEFAAGEGWHSDVSCDLEPPAISMLRFDQLPSRGGDTAFASMYAAYERLSEPMRDFLRGLDALHAGDLPWRNVYGTVPEIDFPRSTHPVVRTHPLTGRPALFVNSGFTERIVGLTGAESDALLALLFDHVAKGVAFQIRVRWEPGTITFWDNRCVQHHASWDYFPETRSGWRVTTRGERPFLEGRAPGTGPRPRRRPSAARSGWERVR